MLWSFLPSASLLVAHGGRFTWDEALMVAVPIAVFAGILVAANRRASEIAAQRDAELAGDASSEPASDDHPSPEPGPTVDGSTVHRPAHAADRGDGHATDEVTPH